MKIGLTMIVKNEAAVIGRCLDSVFGSGLIDYFSIVDTGSTDNTMEIVKEKAKEYNINGIRGAMIFTDFASCRNFSLTELERNMTVDWGFWIDADEVLVLDKDFDKTAFLESTSMNEHAHVMVKEGNNEYYRNNFFKIKEDVKWHGTVHEYLKSEGYFEKASGLHIDRFYDGYSWSNPREKTNQYIRLLEAQIKAEPKESRWVYYLADTLRMVQTPATDKMAIDYYLKRINMAGGNIEEIYVSNVMVASLKFKVYNTKDYRILEECGGYNRVEHLMTLAKFSMTDNNYEAAYVYLKEAFEFTGKPPLISSMIIDASLYYFSIPFVFSQVCYITQRYKESLTALEVCQKNIRYAATAQEKATVIEGFELLKEKIKD